MYNSGESHFKAIEELVLDFLTYRKNKLSSSSSNFNQDLENNKSWQFYNSSLYDGDFLKSDNYYSPQYYDMQNYMNDNEEEEQSNRPMDMETDMEFMRQLYSEINNRLHDYVVDVVNENEYEGSPIYDEHMTREYIAQLVDQVLEKAARSINEVEEINLDQDRQYWGRPKLLRSTVETSLLHELYGHRRPMYRRYRNNTPKQYPYGNSYNNQKKYY